jgi:hypothetical protein
MDFAKEVEAGHTGSESRGPALCQEFGNDSWTVSPDRNQSTCDRCGLIVPSTHICPARRKTHPSVNSIAELNRK